MNIIVTIPAYNEEKTIGKVIGDLLGIDFWDAIYIIDDGSTDRTNKIINNLI